MARLAERKAAKSSQTAAALKQSAPSPSRQSPPRRAPSTTSTVSNRSTQRASSNTSTVSSTSSQRNREMSPIAWQLLLPKTRAAAPLPASQPIEASRTPINTDKVCKQQGPPRVYQPDNQRLPGKSCLKSGSQLTKAKKSVQWQKKPADTVVVVARWINPEDCHENWETTCGKIRRFDEYTVLMSKKDGTFTHEWCDCTMHVLQLTPEKRLPYYADTILEDCRKLSLSTASSARMCSIADGTGITR